MTEPPADDRPLEMAAVIEALAKSILGEHPTMTLVDVSKRTGIPPDAIASHWRALGYPEVDATDVAFTKADAESLKATMRLLENGSFDTTDEAAFIRTVGRTYSRLAEWQVRAILPSILEAEGGSVTRTDAQQLGKMLKLGVKVQENIWRRHLAGAATRLALQHVDEWESEPACVGFVDIVGFTSRSRSLTNSELATLVDRFESVASELVTDHGGRVVKTIGDEVFFVVDDPVDAAWLGVELAEQHLHDPSFPNVRVGIAHGPLLHRLGDVLGPVVNMASRLTSIAPPGRVIIDSSMASKVRGEPGLRMRRIRRVVVKGFDPIDAYALKTERDTRRRGIRGAIEDAADEISVRLPATAIISTDLPSFQTLYEGTSGIVKEMLGRDTTTPSGGST